MTKIDLELMEKSSIKIRLDITNQHIAYTLQMRLVEAFQHFLEQLVRLLAILLQYRPDIRTLCIVFCLTMSFLNV